MSEIIKNRSELLFLYEAEYTNPNGDPMKENRPRFDDEESKALVSDVRLKRTIRDYWFEYRGFNGKNDKDIFVRETKYSDGDKEYISSGKRRVEQFRADDKKMTKEDLQKKIVNMCIDIRTFGGVLPMDKDSITLTGAVQFNVGKSLNKTEVLTEEGTGAFASGEGKGQDTIRTEYKLPYALIGFNGIINEKAAQYTKMTEDDKEMLLKGIWEGTKNLISRSKFGQAPLLLLSVNYKEPFYIGNLRQRLKLECEGDNTLKIRNINDYKLDISELISVLKQEESKIESIDIQVDNRLRLVYGGKDIQLKTGKLSLHEIG